MAEIWGAAIAVGGAVVSGIAAEKKAKQDRANANADRKAATKEEAQYSAVESAFNAQLEDYYSQLNRQRKQRGLDEFRSFSTLSSIAPEYTQTNSGIVLPNSPDVNQIISQQVPTEQTTSGGKKTSTAKKLLDPLGLF